MNNKFLKFLSKEKIFGYEINIKITYLTVSFNPFMTEAVII